MGRLVRMKENLEKAMKDLEEQGKLGMFQYIQNMLCEDDGNLRFFFISKICYQPFSIIHMAYIY